ncbi:MAG: hypothetical protein AABZ31_14680 [Bdellovibrionota bacterium]
MISKIKSILLYTSLSLLFIFLIYGVLLSRYSPSVFSNDLVFKDPEGLYDYSGVMNVHTIAGSGSGTIPEIAEAAEEGGINFVVFTDLNTPQEAREDEGYINNVLVLVGSQYKYLDSLLLNIDGNLDDRLQGAGRSQILLTDILSDETRTPGNGMFILAHPLKPGYKWSGEYPVGLDAIEVFNLKGIWQWTWLKDHSSFIWTLITYPFNPKLAFARLFAESSDEEIDLWDQLNRDRKVIGISGSAAESRVRFLGHVYQFPSYQTLFSIMRNHVLLTSELTGSFEVDKKKIMAALKQGQSYMSLDLLANPKGFNSYIKDSDGKKYLIGSEIKTKKNLELVVQLPSKPHVPFQVIVYRDSQRILTSTSPTTSLPIREPGSYRVVVRLRVILPIPDGKKWIPWIFTNPIRVN